MLFNLIDTIEQVKHAGFSGDSIVYFDKSGNVVSKDGNSAHVIGLHMKEFRLGMSFIFCFTQKGNNLEIYKNGNLEKKMEGPFAVRPFFNNGNWVTVLKEKDEGEQFIRLDADLHETPYEWENSFLTDIKGEFFFCQTAPKLFLPSINRWPGTLERGCVGRN